MKVPKHEGTKTNVTLYLTNRASMLIYLGGGVQCTSPAGAVAAVPPDGTAPGLEPATGFSPTGS